MSDLAFARPAALSVRQLSKSYPAEGDTLTVLQRISLDLARGEFLSIVGASGCGKSTLLRLIGGLDQRYDGEILLDGQAIAGPGLDRGVVFQDHRLFPWLNVHDNVGLGLDTLALTRAEREERIHEQLELVGLASFASAYPHQLSGGMSQRAAIARALVSRPDILLMDEPFGALDALTRVYLQEELLRIWSERQITAIVVTHDVEEAVFLGDRVAVMAPRPGRIQHIADVSLARPRRRDDEDFIAIKQQVSHSLRR